MAIKVAINGFGRIGRLALRAIIENNRSDVEVVAINDLQPASTCAHLLKYDTVHGNLWNNEIKSTENSITVDGKEIKVFAERSPSDLPWGDLGVDVVYECTGIFTDSAKAKVHLDAGAKKVLISAPASGDVDLTVVYGVNHSLLTSSMTVVSNASCTTNCLSPVAKVLDEVVGIEKGFMTTIHSYTGDQPTVDSAHSDLRRARAAACNMVPTTTGAAKAVGLVLPQLKGKLDGVAIRVPTPNVSLVDLTFNAKKATSAEEINAAMKKASEGELAIALGYYDAPLVSSDFNHRPHTSCFDATGTIVMDGTLVRIISWYDNEWGFASRMNDTALAMMNA